MITQQQYYNALADSDFFIRSEVLHSFADEPHNTLEATAVAMAVIDQHGWTNAFQFSYMINAFPLDEKAARWALQKARELGTERFNAGYHLLMWVCEKAPLPVLQNLSDEIDTLGTEINGVLPGAKAVLRKKARLDYAQATPQELLNRLQHLASECVQHRDFPGKLIEDAGLVCQQLADVPEFADALREKVAEWLDGAGLKVGAKLKRSERSGLWLGGFAIDLAGRLGMEAQVPRLLELFELDWDWINELIQEALRRLRNIRVMSVCAEAFSSLPWHGRLYLADVFESTRFPELENLVVGLLDKEPDDWIRVRLATALVHCATPEAQRVARSVYMEDEYDPERFTIAEILHMQFRIQGIQDPALAQWRDKIASQHSKMNMRPELLSFLQGEEEEAVRKPEPEPPKIGRNELCPCGSGKKFKKCCLNS